MHVRNRSPNLMRYYNPFPLCLGHDLAPLFPPGSAPGSQRPIRHAGFVHHRGDMAHLPHRCQSMDHAHLYVPRPSRPDSADPMGDLDMSKL